MWLRQWAIYHLTHENNLWHLSNNFTDSSPQWETVLRRNFLRVLLVIKELWLAKVNKPKFPWNYNEHLRSSLITENKIFDKVLRHLVTSNLCYLENKKVLGHFVHHWSAPLRSRKIVPFWWETAGVQAGAVMDQEQENHWQPAWAASCGMVGATFCHQQDTGAVSQGRMMGWCCIFGVLPVTLSNKYLSNAWVWENESKTSFIHSFQFIDTDVSAWEWAQPAQQSFQRWEGGGLEHNIILALRHHSYSLSVMPVLQMKREETAEELSACLSS